MSAALGVFRLQQVDRQLDQSRARLDQIRQTLENDVELRAVLERVESARKEKSLADGDLREAEAHVKNQQVKIEQADGSLYGGQVRNPKELQDLQNEVAALKRHLATLEERELEAMQRAETGEAALNDAQSGLDVFQTALGSQNGRLIEEQNILMKDLDRLNAERKAIVAALAGQALEQYENLRQNRRGLAVAEVSENTCSACGTTLTPALRQNARSTTQIAHCPACGRILYAS
jgi:predicted  nucleic acid-binding Zn-ribbon protein